MAGLDSALALRAIARVPLSHADSADAVLVGHAGKWPAPTVLVVPADRVADMLDAGADDAVAAEAGAREIAARVAASIRRRAALRFGSLRIDPLSRRVERGGTRIPLLPREFALLHHLAREGGRTVARAELLRAIWGLPFDPGTNVVEVHVSRLRAKLDRGHAEPLLVTERGRGYRLRAA